MEHYGTLAEADAYHAARGRTAWEEAAEQARTAALIVASDYLDGRYRYQLNGCWRSMFSGSKTAGRAQEREWPRTGAKDSAGEPIPADEVPAEIQRATYEAAYRELTEAGSLSPDYVPGGQVTREKVGPVEVSYAAPQVVDGIPPNMPVIPVIDGILGGLLCQRVSVGIGVRVV